MNRLGPTRLVPLGALLLVQGAALALSVFTLSRHPEMAQAEYVPWVLSLGLPAGAALVLFRPRPVPAGLVLVVWALVVQLVLLPPGFSAAFRVLVATPVLALTVLSLPGIWGPGLAMLELISFLVGQGSRTAWGAAVAAADDETRWALGVLGLVLSGATWALKSAFARRDELEAEVVHLKEGVQQIVQANVGFQELVATVEQASSRRERLHITREIHDIVGYTLTNQTMVLQAATVLLDRDHAKLRELLDSAQESARSGLQEVRQALRQLRAGAERPAALLNRLSRLCRTFEHATGVKVDLSGAQTPDNLPSALELVLYRLVQEGLTNAFLHGKANRVSVGLALVSGDLSVHLADNGVGAENVIEGIGLVGMRERLAPFGGTLEYEGGPHGFTVWVNIPAAALREEP